MRNPVSALNRTLTLARRRLLDYPSTAKSKLFAPHSVQAAASIVYAVLHMRRIVAWMDLPDRYATIGQSKTRPSW
jgi:hypothetical protein